MVFSNYYQKLAPICLQMTLVFFTNMLKKIENVLNDEFPSLCHWSIDHQLSIHFAEDETKSILFAEDQTKSILFAEDKTKSIIFAEDKTKSILFSKAKGLKLNTPLAEKSFHLLQQKPFKNDKKTFYFI